MKTQQKPAKRSPKKHIALVIPPRPTSAPAPVAPVAIAEPAAPASAAKPKSPLVVAADLLADELGETKLWPRRQIRTICWALGMKQARDLVTRAREIHAGEGMLVKNGSRKKTLGGIWFTLAYNEGKAKEGRVLVKPRWQPKKKKAVAVKVDQVQAKAVQAVNA